MNRNELISCLDAICDAEEAIYAIDRNIENIQSHKLSIHQGVPPECPKEPKMEEVTPQYHYFESFILEIVFIILGCLIGIIITALLHIREIDIGSSIFSSFLELLLSLAPIGIGGVLGKVAISFFEDKINERRKEKSQRRIYNDKMTQYKLSKEQYLTELLPAYQQKEIIVRLTREELEKEIQNLQNHRKEISENLSVLYRRCSYYQTFQNLVAVHQIREYLAMGICNTLDGPNGAYAQYMLDVRTNQICGSIKQLEQTVRDFSASVSSALSGIAVSQQSLFSEIRTANINTQALSTELSKNINIIQQTLQNSHVEDMKEIQRMLANMSHTISVSAYNQYYLQRENNVKGYLLRNPNI